MNITRRWCREKSQLAVFMESEDDDASNSCDIKTIDNFVLPFVNSLEVNTDISSKSHKRGAGILHKKTSLFDKDITEMYSGNNLFVLSNEYHYKTESYYRIVLRENQNGYKITPSSDEVLDAYVVPICLTKAEMVGIPVCEWGISDTYCPLPSMIYGINYYSDSSKFEVVKDLETAKEAIKKVTHGGKYPFCFQRLPPNSEIKTFSTLFGKNTTTDPEICALLEKIYEVFEIPVAKIILIYDGEKYYLSSISPMRNSEISSDEKEEFKTRVEIGIENGEIRNFC